jgi:hypothetical protein
MEVAVGGVIAAVVAAVVSAGVSLWTRARERRQRSELLQKELEHQTNEILRRAYAQLLTAQRRSRELSIRLAEGGGSAADATLAGMAIAAHDDFIDCYHQLNLDSTPEMWLEVRGLRHVLDKMLEKAQAGDAAECRILVQTARDARQNLERTFRERLGHEALQARHPLGSYDKVMRAGKPNSEPHQR